ncbi:hypothetical protein Pcinc_042889 [Petrolisthes cinctipes]|uniref:Uncharacterized protein n=1 Tax=Petrolisthes cinctipes TaxID=88211 RepID=A0AAE1EGS8_PETCI|nr:hypothetical protein Pcinc_042889 [Petrolisthes cinctipes]
MLSGRRSLLHTACVCPYCNKVISNKYTSRRIYWTNILYRRSASPASCVDVCTPPSTHWPHTPPQYTGGTVTITTITNNPQQQQHNQQQPAKQQQQQQQHHRGGGGPPTPQQQAPPPSPQPQHTQAPTPGPQLRPSLPQQQQQQPPPPLQQQQPQQQQQQHQGGLVVAQGLTQEPQDQQGRP